MAEMTIDCDYAGGNIIVEEIDGDVIRLRQDLRDTEGWWFYWNFRIRGAEGRSLTFRFTNEDVFGIRGPAVSFDGGTTWSWLGTKTVTGSTFDHVFSSDANDVRFAFAPPYQEADLKRFLSQHKRDGHVEVDELCKTRKGRSVERIRIGKLDRPPSHRVLVTCRHHSCESTASYVLEGLLAALMADTIDGRWFRDNVEVLAVPFVDKDGVEDGDQGKNRRPRDHCRDYEGTSIYPTVGALRTLVREWSSGRLRIVLDLHCPYIRDNAIYLVGSQYMRIWNEQRKFAEILESVGDRALPYRASDNLPFGKGWSNMSSYEVGRSFFQWADTLEDIWLSSAIEIPYAQAGEVDINSDGARAFGADLVHAMHRYII